MQTRRVLGIDPGRRHMGYAVIDERLLTAGVWQFSPETPALLPPAGSQPPGPSTAGTTAMAALMRVRSMISLEQALTIECPDKALFLAVMAGSPPSDVCAKGGRAYDA